MFDIILFMFIVLLCQIAVLRVWLTSELFSGVQAWLVFMRDHNQGVLRSMFYMTTCWQCAGVWVSWAVTALLAYYLPNSPIPCSVPVVLIVGLGVAFVSEALYHTFIYKLDTIEVFNEEEEDNALHWEEPDTERLSSESGAVPESDDRSAFDVAIERLSSQSKREEGDKGRASDLDHPCARVVYGDFTYPVGLSTPSVPDGRDCLRFT